ncbi:hypothetical protein P9D54_15970 [Bacillus haynesii]|nr:hypothetical protein [Bacillus haynesii]MEC1346845.1 hypothetical protein [Bacillus haynesii]
MSQKGAADQQLERGSRRELREQFGQAGSVEPKSGITAWMMTA